MNEHDEYVVMMKWPARDEFHEDYWITVGEPSWTLEGAENDLAWYMQRAVVDNWVDKGYEYKIQHRHVVRTEWEDHVRER